MSRLAQTLGLSTLIAPTVAFAAANGGDLVVGGGADTALGRITKGEEAAALGPLAEFDEPRGLAFGPDGRLYVAAFGADAIVVVDPTTGTVLDQWTDPGLDGPTALAFSVRGDLFVASRETNRVLRFDRNGTKLAAIGSDSTLDTPSGLAVAPNGNLFVTAEQNNAIYEFDADGEFIRVATIGCGSFLGIFGLAFGWDGLLYTSCRDDHAIKVIDGDLTIVGTLGAGVLQQPMALAFGPDDLLYVADSAGQVLALDRTGNQVTSFALDAVNSPQTLAFQPSRFATTIDATLIRDGVGRDKVKEKYSKASGEGPVLSIAPGSQWAMIQLTDDLDDDFDLASLVGTTCLVLPASEAVDPATTSQRAIAAAALLGTASDDPVGTLAVTVKGKGSFFAPKSVGGTFTIAGRGFTVFATVETAGKP